jgi:hypothetical protein
MYFVSVNLYSFLRIAVQITYLEEEIEIGNFVMSYILHYHVPGKSVHSSKSMLMFIILVQLLLKMLREWTPNTQIDWTVHFAVNQKM